MILGKIREIRDQSPLFLENTNFWKSLPRVPNFEYPSLAVHFHFTLFKERARLRWRQKSSYFTYTSF